MALKADWKELFAELFAAAGARRCPQCDGRASFALLVSHDIEMGENPWSASAVHNEGPAWLCVECGHKERLAISVRMSREHVSSVKVH
jgi:Zn ribbon nucleic-acid-binding protein